MTDLRPVTMGDCVPVQPASQPAPRLDWVRIADLVIDDRYQRPLGRESWRHIQRIAAEFSWAQFQSLLVAPLPGGKLALVDGQHRAHAALICGFDTVPAMIVPMAPEEQARAFAGVNGRITRVTPWQVYRAALASGETWAERAQLAVEAAGCQLMTYNSSQSAKKAGQVYTVVLIRDLVVAGHSAAVTAGLRALRAVDGDTRVPLYSEFILRPWLRAVASDPAYPGLDLAGVLRRHDPYRVLERLRREAGSCRDGRAVFARILSHVAREVAA